MSYLADTAVYIGRFQPPHLGHLALLQMALRHAPHVVVVLGSAWQAPSAKNPFTWQERARMMADALDPQERRRVQFLPVRDYYNEARWVAAVRHGVAGLRPNVAPSDVALIGHFKDATSSYLRSFAPWQWVSVPRQGDVDATRVRRAYFGGESGGQSGGETPAQALAQLVAPATFAFLQNWSHTPTYAALCEEWRALEQYRAAWAAAPYPPVFVTVDALVRCQGQVLLIRRGHAPGKGQWALPGGFVEPRDTLWQSTVRELAEETALDADEAALRAALQSVAVFDHPDRSQRGRTITHAHFIDLDQPTARQRLPQVRAGDDAAAAHWTPITALCAMEAQFFEDHFHILDHFLSLSAQEGAAPT